MAERTVDLTGAVDALREFYREVCKRQVNELVNNYPTRKSLVVDFTELAKYNRELSDRLVAEPDVVLDAARQALVEYGGELAAGVEIPGGKFEPHVRFKLPPSEMLIQSLSSREIGKMVSVKGVAVKRAEVMHRVQKALYRCQACDDETWMAMTRNAQPPKVCAKCKRLTLKLVEEESYFVDMQRATMQELLERLKGGTPAANIELVMEDDLVNFVTPGDTVDVTGVMRLRPPLKAKGPQTVQAYTRYLDVVQIESSKKDFEEVELSEDDEKRVRDLSRDPRLYERFVKSLAPAIYGHLEIKEATMLQLFGGTKDKVMPGGLKIRDDIHLLLIGDPGAAKSRFLQQIKEIAPKSIYVSGKSVSGVGLTASAEKDELGEGGWTLKAGALVLASGGIACVDEFDKIEDEDRAAMHEVMEGGTVSIAKAGIVARFKAKTSILAAANPKHGRFDKDKLPGEQFDIPPTLLSRFDLIFAIRDVMDETRDNKLATQILTHHKRAAERPNLTAVSFDEEQDVDLVEHALLRKYIAYARKNVRPVLSQEASDRLRDFYVDLRRKGKAAGGAVPITPRQIEGLVRLSEASAKTRLSPIVETSDADRAIKLMEFMQRELLMDKETGLLDADIIATGKPKSAVDKENTVFSIIKDLEKEYGQAERVSVIKTADERYHFTETDVLRIIDDLQHRGEIYKVKAGVYRIVGAKG